MKNKMFNRISLTAAAERNKKWGVGGGGRAEIKIRHSIFISPPPPAPFYHPTPSSPLFAAVSFSILFSLEALLLAKPLPTIDKKNL